MIERLILFGATGDLAGRFLLPALAALYEAGKLSSRFQIVAASQSEHDDESFRRHAEEKLTEHAGDVDPAARAAVVKALTYRQADVTDASSVARVVHERDDAVACYLAIPNTLFAKAARAVIDAKLPQGSRIVFEKPFGRDLDDAIALNRLLEHLDEREVFRVDHALGMTTVRNLLPLRSNRLFDTMWNSEYIDTVDILWEETLALEGRAGYYDKAGALKDVMQNHMLQVLCRVAMELPEEPEDLHAKTIDLLRAIRPPRGEAAVARTRRARYTAGRGVPNYADEEGVDPSRETETFAEVELTIDNERWDGTRFIMRTAKAFADRRKEVVLHFRGGANELRIGIDGPEDIRFHLGNMTMTAPAPATDLPAYGHVLSDILEGRDDFAVSGDEAVQAWRIFTPVLEAWRAGIVPMEEYPAGASALSPRKLANRPSDDARPRAEQ